MVRSLRGSCVVKIDKELPAISLKANRPMSDNSRVSGIKLLLEQGRNTTCPSGGTFEFASPDGKTTVICDLFVITAVLRRLTVVSARFWSQTHPRFDPSEAASRNRKRR